MRLEAVRPPGEGIARTGKVYPTRRRLIQA